MFKICFIRKYDFEIWLSQSWTTGIRGYEPQHVIKLAASVILKLYNKNF